MKDLIEMGICQLDEVSFVVSQLCFSLCCSYCLWIMVGISYMLSSVETRVLDINSIT
jgi:hypothetical protein